MKSYSKRVMTAILAVVMLLSVIAPIYASAAQVTMDLSKVEISREHDLVDGDGNLIRAAYGLKEEDNPFGYEMKPMTRRMRRFTAISPTAPADESDWVYGKDCLYCFCIEHGVPLPDSTIYSGSTSENHGNKYAKLSAAQKTLLSLVLSYGYPNRSDVSTEADKDACYGATQLIVWQITLGFRTSATELNDKTIPLEGYSGTMTEQYTRNKYIKKYYDRILADMASHYTRPSFTSNVPASAKTYELTKANGKYTLTLTDTNNVLSKYKVTADGGTTVTISGDKLTVTSSKPLTEDITIKLNRRMPTTDLTTGFLIWTVADKEDTNQDLVSGVPANNDPVPSYLKVAAVPGSVKIVKESEDGVVDGIKFKVTGNGVDQTVTTANGGVFQINDLRPGTYTVTELTEDKYEEQAPQTVTVTSGQTATVTFSNILKRGDLEIIKTSEDGKVDNILFTVTGNGVNESVRTDESGKIKIDGLLPGTYTVTEHCESYYESQPSQTVTVAYGQTATVSFKNVLKRGDLIVTKTAEDGLEEGVRFRLTGTSDSGTKVDVTATVDSTGKAYFRDILVGSGYVLEEVDTAIQYIVPASQTTPIEWNKVTQKDFYNELKRGDLKVIKTAEDDFVEGVKFHLYGTSLSGEKVDVYALTDSNGIAVFEDILIGDNYTLEEVDTAERYIIPDSQTTPIEWNKVTQKDFYNELKRGDLKVIKTSEDDFVEGVKFHLYGTALSGEQVDEYAVTDSNGVAVFKDILIGENYTIEEVDTAVRYVVPEDQTGAIRWNEVTEVSFHNVLKKWRADAQKLDKETDAQSQGDATLEGAVYGVYKDGVLVDSYTTDENGAFVTDYYPCYEDVEWTIREISPSEGYLLDPTVYHPDTDAGQYTVERNTAILSVYEDVIKGKVSIIKHTDDGSTKIETPEAGAEFEVYLKSAGSYEAADATERDILVCDEFGFAMTKDLPYGTYVVKQTKGWAGREQLPAFEVFVSEDGEEYRYLINNADFHSYLHVVKADATTGKTIPYAGAGFQIYAPDGTLVTMTYTYPTLTVIDTFYTDENGTLLTPEKLPYGEGYSLVEVQAPHGYVLDATPIYFDVTNENSAYENGITIVKVVKENEPQKGSISVSKSGEVFSSVVEHEGIYQPTYEIQGLAGAVYEIRAAEDVITPEGTLRYSKDEVVATITTGEDGTAASEPLFLGKYTIQEITAPNGMVINGDIVTVELTYAGQEIQITTTSAAFVNERQKAEISLEKVMEQDEKYEIGLGDEILSVQFGLFAMEDIIAADGTMIPKDGLIETVFCDENGKAAFATDLPVGSKVYVKELAADDHYLVSDSIHPVIFEYAGQEVALVEIPINEGKPIHNEIIRGSIIGKKLDEDGFTICGAVFGLFRENETVFTEETALAVATSNEIGVFGFEDVPYGRWIVREIKAAPAFVLNENSYAVTVGEDEEIVEIIIENDFITGSVTTTKVDAEYPDNKLTGAVFEIYVDVDGNGEFDAQIDKLVGEMTETEAGVYVMNDLRYNGYFLYEKVAPEGFLKDEGYHYFEIRNDGETVTVENEAGVGFINQPSTGELELTKKDVSIGKLLANVGFRIRNEAGEVVAEGYTDENGIAKFTLRQGKYTYQEFAPLEGYILDETEYPFEIKENGEIVKAVMTNEPTPDIPQTGDDSNIGFWIGLAAIALGGLIATVIIVIKQKKDDE